MDYCHFDTQLHGNGQKICNIIKKTFKTPLENKSLIWSICVYWKKGKN